MAVVTKKDKDQKYKHLKQLYTEPAVQIENKKSKKEVVLQKENIKISKKELLVMLLVITLIGVISSAGYLLARF